MENFVVLTGPPGSGKTALLEALRGRGAVCVDEPARRVIAEQRLTGGRGTSEQDPDLFVQLMLKRAIDEHTQCRNSSDTVFFDRGIPDLLAYADHFGLDPSAIHSACRLHRYSQTAYFTPPWEDIYTTDDERRMTFEAAATFGEAISQAYGETGYHLVQLPLVSVDERAEFVLTSVRQP